MDWIASRQLNTRHLHVKVREGFTLQDVCKALNAGTAGFQRDCPSGLPVFHNCQHPEHVVHVYLGVMADVLGSSISTSRSIWSISAGSVSLDTENEMRGMCCQAQEEGVL